MVVLNSLLFSLLKLKPLLLKLLLRRKLLSPLPKKPSLLKKQLKKAAKEDSWLSTHPPVIEWFEGQFESGQTEIDAKIVKALQKAHQKIWSTSADIKGVTYGSDLRLFTNHAGMPAVLYGPGDVRQAHAVEEAAQAVDRQLHQVVQRQPRQRLELLAQQRAENVRAMLIELGVDEAQIQMIEPQQTEAAPGQSWQARRVDVSPIL